MSEVYDFQTLNTRLRFEELLRLSGLEAKEVEELLELGLFEPQYEGESLFFSTQCLFRARCAARLRRDFDLNLSGVVLALTYLERIETLEDRLQELECQQLR